MNSDYLASGARRLVVFGAGYVGGALVKQALGEGWQVVALTRNSQTADTLRAMGAGVVVAELAERGWWTAPELAGGAERVAVTVAAGGGGVAGYWRSYVDGLCRVNEWGRSMLATGGLAGHLLYTSSTSVYPQGGGVRVTEADEVGGEAETTRALVEAERCAAAWPGRGTTILRLAGIYGPGRTHLIEQVQQGQVAGSPTTHLNLIHRDDIVPAMEAVWACADRRRSEVEPAAQLDKDPNGSNPTIENTQTFHSDLDIFNLADESAASKGEVVEWLAKRLGMTAPVFTGMPAGGRRAVTPDRVIDARRAREVLGWRPRWPTFRDGYGQILSDFSKT